MKLPTQWLHERYRGIVGSIAFLPAVIALLLLATAIGMVAFDFSEQGKAIKSNLHWLSLKDATTARSIISSVVTGIISLAVFSFSLVMIILNQTAANMSNRILDKLIENRFQQVVLGFYIGSIVYALFLLSTIRDINEGVYVPALSVYLLITLTITDIFLFIYFLHYVTQAVKYETIIGQIARQTRASLKDHCSLEQEDHPVALTTSRTLRAPASGILQKVHSKALVRHLRDQGLCAALLHQPGDFVLEGTPYLHLAGGKEPYTRETEAQVQAFIVLGTHHRVDDHYDYGFRQLMEVAVKALSPGINDPGTAVESLQAIAVLLHFRSGHHPQCNYYDEEGQLRLVVPGHNFEQLCTDTLHPIWHYGRKDPVMQQGMQQVLKQLAAQTKSACLHALLAEVGRERFKTFNKLTS